MTFQSLPASTGANLPPREGDFPEGWTTARVDDCFDSWGGLTPSTAEAGYWGGHIPWISSKDVKDWRLREAVDFVTDRALRETRLRICPKGSVLVVVRSGILAHTLPVTVVERDVVINQDVKAFVSPESALNEWLALSLRALAPTILGRDRKDGTTVHSVEFRGLKALVIAIPPLGRTEAHRGSGGETT